MVEWPYGSGAAVERVRAFDWASTSLGPVAGWPQSLKLAAELVLASPFPNVLLWGPNLTVCAYNDAYRPMLGSKPEALGRSHLEVWSEAREIIAPQLERAMRGETLAFKDAPFTLQRGEGPEEAWFDYGYSPVRDETGAVVGVLNTAVERARAEAALQASEEKYRTLFESIDEAICVVEIVEGSGDAPDFRYVEVNDAFERQAGLRGVAGKLGSEVVPGAEPSWREAYGEIVRTGEPKRVENHNQETGRWYDVFASRIGGVESQLVCIVSQDITESREREKRQAFLLQLSDDYRENAGEEAVGRTCVEALARYMGVDRCYITEMSEPLNGGLVGPEYYSPGLGPVSGRHAYENHPDGVRRFESGHPMISADVDQDPTLSETDKVFIGEGLGLQAIATASLCRGGGETVWALAVGTRAPRAWTREDQLLLQDVAERTWAAIERARSEQALRGSETRFRALTTAAAYSIYRMSPDWRLMYQLDSVTLAPTAAPIENWTEKYIPPEELPAVTAAIADAIAAKSVFELEHRVWAAEGGVAWVLSRAVPILDDAGEVCEWFGAGTDVTERRRAEDALRESEALFREFGENSSDALWIIDAQTRRLEYLSPAFERIWGEGRERVLADLSRWAELAHPDDRAAASQALPRLLVGQPFQADYRIVRPDGEVRWIRDAGFPMKEGGVVKRAGGIAQDVTDLKRAEAAVRESEARLRQFGDASQDILWIRDAATLQWQYLTPAFEKVYGLSREEALAGDNLRNWLELIVPEDRPRVLEHIRRVRAGEQVAFEYRVQRPSDGAIRWLRNTDFPLLNDAGQVALIGGIGHDLTGLREIELRLQALIEGIPQLVWRAGDAGLWTWASPQWTDFTGQGEVCSHGWGWLDPLHPDDRAAAREAWSHAVERRAFAVEYRVRAQQSGDYRWFQTRAVPVQDQAGDIVEWLGTSTDINDLRELQARQGVLVAELQHRTRNLITVVGAVSRQTLAEAASLDDFQHRFSDRLTALSRVQGLLSHLSAGARVTFDELLGSELEALGAPADKITLNGPAGVPLRSATVQTFSLALHELATNALKYGALAAVDGHLSVNWTASGSGGDDLRLKVDWRESGVVMPKVGERPGGGGYGRELIEHALPYQLGAETTYELTPDGVHCTIDVPTSAPNA